MPFGLTTQGNTFLVTAALDAASSHREAAGAQVRELEEEVEALQAGRAHRAKLMALMEKKSLVGDLFNQLRLARAPRGAGDEGQGRKSRDAGLGMQQGCHECVCSTTLLCYDVPAMPVPG